MPREPLPIRTPLRLTFLAVLVLTAVWGVISNMRAIVPGPGRTDPTDFNIFHLAGGLTLSGRLGDAYFMSTMLPLERALTGSEGFMPWSYPPLFAILLAPLAALPLGLAQALFVAGSLALFLAVTHRLGGDQVWPVWLAVVPCLVLNLQSGQNGLLTGGLAGLAALRLLDRQPVGAGLAIAADLAIKPHLALMFPVFLVVERRWLTLMIAGLGAAAFTALSIAVVGWTVFADFVRSFGEVQRFMAAGAYPLQRMTSLYAALLSFGMRPGPALAVHCAAALAILACVARILFATEDTRLRLGLAIAATVFISPYMYDYDATILGVGLTLLGPTLSDRLSARRYGFLLTGLAAGLAVGLLSVRLSVDRSVAGLILVPLFGIVLRVLSRDPGEVATAVVAGVPGTVAS